MAGAIVHVDIPASDTAQSAQFYRDVFGWQIDESFPGYPMFSSEGGPGGGFAQKREQGVGSLGSVVIYLQSSDVDATLQQVQSKGGSVVIPKTEIEGGHGTFAVFTDPAGNNVGVYQPPSR